MTSEIGKLNETFYSGVVKTITDQLTPLGLPFDIAVPLTHFVVYGGSVAFRKWGKLPIVAVGGLLRTDRRSVWDRVNVDDDAMVERIWGKQGSAEAVARITNSSPATSIDEFRWQLRQLQERA